MNDHERRISGLPANDLRVENYIANGLSGRDNEVLDGDVASADNPLAYIDVAAWDVREQQLIDQLLLVDLSAKLDTVEATHVARQELLTRSLGAPALELTAA